MDRLKILLGDLKLSDSVEASHFARLLEIEALRGALTALDEKGVLATKNKAWAQVLVEMPDDRAWDII